MAGESSQEKAINKQMSQISGLQSDIKGGQYDTYNRFNNYNDPFDFNSISNNLNDIFGETEKKINRNTADQIANEQSNAASRFASRGVTGGSVMEDNANKIATGMNTGKVNALSDLGIGKASSTADLQKYFNQLGLAKTKYATGVDQSNNRNALSSLLQSYGAQQGLIGGMDDSTWLDDAFAGVGTAAQIGTMIAASDRNFKENIVRVGQTNGIPIYEFSYLKDTKRFRGVMSDEIPQEAVIKVGAIDFVDYSKLPGITMEEL